MNPLKDDPNFHIDEETAEASARLIEEGRFGEQFQEQGCLYAGNLISDCASVASLGEQLTSLMSDPPAENIFARAHRLNGDDAQREQQCNGFYSMKATGRN